MQNFRTIDHRGAIPDMAGRTILGLYADYGSAALLLDRNETLCFVSEVVAIGKWFEVFPIQISTACPPEIGWAHLTLPFSVSGLEYLWREEWQESLADDGVSPGNAPHHAQFAMPLQSAPLSVEEVVKVCAGVRITSEDGQVLVICSSSSNPFGMDIAMNPAACDAILKEHTCQ